MNLTQISEGIKEGIKTVIESKCDEEQVKKLKDYAISLYNYYKENNFELDWEIQETLFNYDSRDEISILINDSPWDGYGDNPTFCIELLEIIFNYLCPIDNSFEIIVASNPNTPIKILYELAKSTYWDEEHATTQTIAEYTSDGDLLELLSVSQHGATRWFVAQNPATKSQTLDKLASDNGFAEYLVANGDTDFFIQSAVVDNPNTSLKTLKKIADGKFEITGDNWDEEFLIEINSEIQTKASDILEDS